MATTTSDQKRQANFFISTHTIAVLKNTVPPRKQSEFVEGAIKMALQQKLFSNALKECTGAWKAKDHLYATEKFIRSLRNSKRT